MSDIRIVPGNYESRVSIQVIKKLTQQSAKNSDGTISRTFATWQDSSNFIVFTPGKKIQLTKEDIENETIRQLILKGKLVRVL